MQNQIMFIYEIINVSWNSWYFKFQLSTQKTLFYKLESESLLQNNLHYQCNLSCQKITLKISGQFFLPFKKLYLQFITLNPGIKNCNFHIHLLMNTTQQQHVCLLLFKFPQLKFAIFLFLTIINTAICLGKLCFFFFFYSCAYVYGSFQARGCFGTSAASLHHSHSSTGSKLHLTPTPQLRATQDP